MPPRILREISGSSVLVRILSTLLRAALDLGAAVGYFGQEGIVVSQLDLVVLKKPAAESCPA